MIPFSVDIFLSPALNYRNVSGDNEVIAEKNSYDKMKLSLGGGLRLNYSFREDLYLSLGLLYSNYGERYAYKKETITNKMEYGGYWQQDSLGQTFMITDSALVSVKNESSVKRNNYYRYISVPISLTYSFGKGKMSYAISAGLATNFLTSAYSYRVGSDSTHAAIVESSSGDSQPYRRLTYSLMISPAITYRFNERWKLLLEPGFTYFLSSIYKKDHLFSQKPYSIDIKAGLRYVLK